MRLSPCHWERGSAAVIIRPAVPSDTAALGRLGGLLVVLFLVATMVFFLTRLAPGDPAAIMLGDQATPEDVARLRATFGLDRPLKRRSL